MARILVKLKDSNSTFHDVASGQTISGKEAVEVERTGRIEKALRGGALVQLSDAEAAAHNKTVKPAEKKAEVKAEKVEKTADAKEKGKADDEDAKTGDDAKADAKKK